MFYFILEENGDLPMVVLVPRGAPTVHWGKLMVSPARIISLPVTLSPSSNSCSLSLVLYVTYQYITLYIVDIVAGLRLHWMSTPQRILCALTLTLPSYSLLTFKKSRTSLFLSFPPPSYITLARSLTFTSSFSHCHPIMSHNQVPTPRYRNFTHCFFTFLVANE